MDWVRLELVSKAQELTGQKLPTMTVEDDWFDRRHVRSVEMFMLR